MDKAQSLIIGRKKTGEDSYNILVNLFDVDNPHLSTKSPIKFYEFSDKALVVEKSGRFKFLPAGNDIVINSISGIDLEEDGEEVKLIIHKE